MQSDIPLSPYTTMRVGGSARFFVCVKTRAELGEALSWAQQHEQPVFILGGGSNIVVHDAGWDGLVIKIGFESCTYESAGNGAVDVIADAGMEWDALVKDTVARGFPTLANLSHIPGTVGAAPIQNIGAYGVEISESIVWLEAVHLFTGSTRVFMSEECAFRYRTSIFKNARPREWCITRVAFRLREDDTPRIDYRDLQEYFSSQPSVYPDAKTVREAVITIRGKKFPSLDEVGTCGSFFKNPVISDDVYRELQKQYPALPAHSAGAGYTKISAAWILDNILNLKGYREGGVGLHSAQPLVVVHYLPARGLTASIAQAGAQAGGNATAREVNTFAEKVAHMFYEKTGVVLEREVESVGDQCAANSLQ